MPKPMTFTGDDVVPGVNVDRIDVAVGVAEATRIGYSDANMTMVVEYCLSRWAKGEEDLAQRTALTSGISLTSWYRILAAARAAGEEHARIYESLDKVIRATMNPDPAEDYSAALHSLVNTIVRTRRKVP